MTPRVPRPIRRIRRVFKRIDYYSASRNRTWWRRAADWWLLLALPVAIALVFLLDARIMRSNSQVMEFEIRLGRLDSSAPLICELEFQPERSWHFPQPVAAARMSIDHVDHGWPMATTETIGPTRVDVRFFDGREQALAGPFPSGDDENTNAREIRQAIVEVLSAANMTNEASAWIAGTRESRANILAFVAAVLMAWAILFLLGIPLIQLLRAGIAAARNHHRLRTMGRLRKGVCPSCRYNLGGSTFPERCPECGTRIWGS
ncbi:MAG: hypothetical protein MK085_00475 [Phycisphaerales bacterium]|nr:hypothetical protein [Phycisphaerales bacterium]